MLVQLAAMLRICVILLVLLIDNPVFSQSNSIQDSIAVRLRSLSALSQTGNFERAQIEVEDFLWFVRRERTLMPLKAIPLISNIYLANRDEKSALKFLAETDLDIRKEKDLGMQTLLLNALIHEYERWELPEKALACQRRLSVAQDSLASLKVTAETIRWKRQLDSLKTIRALELARKGTVYEIEKNRAYTILGIAALLLLSLLATNYMTADRWRRRLEQKELEFEILRSIPQEAGLPSPPQQELNGVPTPAAETQYLDAKPAHVGWSAEEVMPKTALVIETNRQIVLYMKSLLADQFEVETASSAIEALQMAQEMMPDLVVCDAVLNGTTGIEVIRQLKFSEKTSHIPVILLTDKGGSEAQLDVTRCGAETWFQRPLLDSEMDSSVKQLMGMRRIRQEQFGRSLHLYFTPNRQEIPNVFLQTTLDYIELNLPNPNFMAEELSRKMQMTKHQFYKKLNVLTGKEPAQLIREMRLEKARMLLEKKAAPVQTIAELVGFTSSGTFSLAYKEYFGDNTILLNSSKRLLN